MKALYCILFFLTRLLSSIHCFASPTTTIDSLYNVLPTLKDTGKVDCYNNLSFAYIQLEKKDSAVYFSSIAYKEAKKINYIHGIAVSYLRKARIAKHFDDDFIQSERLSTQSLFWYEKTANKKGLYDVYCELFYSVVPQSRFVEGEVFAMKMYALSEEAGDKDGMCRALQRIAALHKLAGNYEKSFDYCLRLRQLAIKTHNTFQEHNFLFSLGQLYMKIEDYNSALKCYREAFQMNNPEFEKRRQVEDWDIWVKMEYAEIFSHLKQFDSAWHYFELYKPAKEEDRYYRIYLVSTGEYYFLQNKLKKALQHFLLGLTYHKKLNDQNEIQRTLVFIAKTYYTSGNITAALSYGKQALHVASYTKAKQIIRDGYQILYVVYDRLNEADSANYYFRKYVAMKDAVANEQVKAKFAVFNYEQKIFLLDKENQLQEESLRQTTQQKKFLITSITSLFLVGLILFRNLILKRKNEKMQLENKLALQKLESIKTKAELQQQATELEMQALRAQMNPHFIFNSLNSINRFILQNDPAQASSYLTKFSRLVRMILQNSQDSLITLESELETLQLYIELEAVRFNHHFDFKIIVDKQLDTDLIKVPPLLIQPFAENAIWHGLMSKNEKGHLEIELYEEENMLCCKITDDGIGRKKATELKSKTATTHKSMGMQITANRINMLHQTKQMNSTIKITDLILADGNAGGTEVLLKIPLIE